MSGIPIKSYYIDYDRNSSKACTVQMAELLMAAAGEFGKLYVDFYTTPDKVQNLSPNQHVVFDPSEKKPGILANLLSYRRLSAYVCLEVNSSEHLIDVWMEYVHSSPKLYRINKAHTAGESALNGTLIEEFQWVPLDQLNSLLETNIFIFRDFHDEIGLEVVFLESMEKMLQDLMRMHLGKASDSIESTT